LKNCLSEILISSSSYPIIGMCRSIPSHRRPDDLFLINLKMKLHLEIYAPDNCPTCICGQVIDPFALHTFHCVHVSKKAMHDRANKESAPVLTKILRTCGLIGQGADVEWEPRRLIEEVKGLRPFDSFFMPVPSLTRTTIPPVPYSMIGWDWYFTSPKGHLSPSRQHRATSNQPASAVKHLTDAERKKLRRDGASDPNHHNSLTGDEIIGRLLDYLNAVLIPAAVSPYGRWGPMFHNFLFGKLTHRQKKFRLNRPNATRMYHRSIAHPCPIGIVPLAHATWKKEKPKSQLFYGNSHTVPTPKEYLLQELGLVLSNAIAIHIRHAKQGKLTPPILPDDEDFVPPPGTATCNAPVEDDDEDDDDDSYVQPDIFAADAVPPANRYDLVDGSSLWSPSAPQGGQYFPPPPPPGFPIPASRHLRPWANQGPPLPSYLLSPEQVFPVPHMGATVLPR
jgi:hypothetical protein